MRTLNPLEETFWRVDRDTPLNFTFCAHIDGDLNLDVLRAAVAHQFQRYPALAFTAVEDPDGCRWVSTQTAPRIDVVTGGTWHSAMAQSVNTPFTMGVEPGVRLRWIRSGQESRLLVTFNHCLLDGRSGAMVMRTLLNDAATLSQGTSPSGSAVINLHPGPGLTEPRRGTGPLPRKVVHFGALRGQRKTAVLPIELDEEQSLSLLTNARKQGVSTTAVISAAHLLALTDLDSSGPLSLSLPIDWRGRLHQVEPDAFGLLVGNAQLPYRLRAGDDHWALARRLMGDFRTVLSQAQPIADPEAARSLDGVYGSRASTAVSNVGSIEFEGAGGAFEVRSVCFAVGCSHFGDQIITAARSGGRVSLMYCVTTDSVTIPRAQAIASGTVEHLNQMMS